MTYLVLLTVGFAIAAIALRLQEEVLLIAALVASAVFLIWGFALTPPRYQIAVEVALLVVLFPVCVRCFWSADG